MDHMKGIVDTERNMAEVRKKLVGLQKLMDRVNAWVRYTLLR